MADKRTINNSDRFAAITPSDTVNIAEVPRAIYVGVTGDVVAVGSDGNAATFKSVAVGVLPIQPTRINSTNTTATNILALY